MSSITNFGNQADIIAEDEIRQLITDHRYDVIYPIIRGINDGSKRELFQQLSKLDYVNPISNQPVKYSAATIKRWYYTYINSGNQRSSLMVKKRKDAGKTRVLTTDLCNAILELKEEYPYMSATKIHEQLVINGNYEASMRTISDFILKQELNHKKKHDKQRLPFETEFANSVWYADTNYGPYIKVGGQSVRTYLICFIDDASRLITGARYYLEDNSINVQATLKEAVMRCGIPELCYFDQGTPYKNRQLARIIRTIGSNVKHAAPYSPQAKARVERTFRTIDTRWLNNVHHDSFESLEHLNQELDIYINEYNNDIKHSAIGKTPLNRWLEDKERIKYLDEGNIDAYFLHMEKRVVKNDTTIQIGKVHYQLPAFAVKYIGKQINLFFVPDANKSNIEYMISDGSKYVIIQKVDKIENGKRFKGSKGVNDDTTPAIIDEVSQYKLDDPNKTDEQVEKKPTPEIDLSYDMEENENALY